MTGFHITRYLIDSANFILALGGGDPYFGIDSYETGQTETRSGGITDHFCKMSFFRSFISP